MSRDVDAPGPPNGDLWNAGNPKPKGGEAYWPEGDVDPYAGFGGESVNC